MAFIRKIGNEYYIVGRTSNAINKNGGYSKEVRKCKNVFIIKSTDTCGVLALGKSSIICPNELIGKRVRVKLEIVEDEKVI